MGAPSSCGCEDRPTLRFDRRGGFLSADAVPIAAPRPEIQPVLEGVLLTNARRPSATASCGCGCGGSCAAESDTHPCRCGNTSAARVRRMERPFRTEDPRLRLWQLHAEQPEVDLEARIAGLEATGRQVRGDPRLREERTWTVPTSAGLRVETTGMGDSARLDRFGRSASEREPEGLLGPFANVLVPPGIGGDHHPGWGDVPQAFPQPCDMGPDEAPVCAREASMDSHPGEVYTQAEMIEAARGESLESALLDQLSEYVGATVGSLDDLGKELEFTARFVTASSTGGTGFDCDPWSFERAQFVLGWANTSLCSRYVIKPGMLLIRISGTEEHWVKISSAVLGDEGWEPEASLARFVGCATCRSGQEPPRGAGCDPADTDLPSVLDPPTKDLLPPYYIDPGLGVSREVIDQLLRYDWTGMGAPLQRMLRNLLQGGSAGGGH